MGITNDLFPEEVALGVSAEQMKLCSPKRGIEDVRNRQTGMRGIDNFENFMRLLAPIARGVSTEEVRAGETLFAAIGCAACHIPVLTTGYNANPVFDRKPVPLYSDLLLHDAGTGDGIEQSPGTAAEIRTPALWGLRFRRPLLHDGSAATAADALLRHGNEAAAVVERYRRLSPAEQRQIIAFLDSL
jgi:CxxC motif-containing protein (DUF1111 family)